MTDTEFNTYMKSLSREQSADEVKSLADRRDAERGPYIPHGGEVHHHAEESRH